MAASTDWPVIAPLGDAAVRIECGPPDDPATATRVHRLATALKAHLLRGVTDVVPAYSVVVVYYHPLEVPTSGQQLAWEQVARWIERRTHVAVDVEQLPARELVVPVCYGNEFGPDIESVANQNRLSVDEVIRRHSQAIYKVRAVGFSPGFPYLEGLPAELHTPRRATPRTLVPPGSVGIGGGQAGIYPLASPGGWNLIGRTPLRIFRVELSPAALLGTGDVVRFRPIGQAEFHDLQRSEKPPATTTNLESAVDPVFEVLSPGLQTTIQDLGRPGHQAEGVSPGGAMDSLSARVANLLVGNAQDVPVLEAVQSGPRLRLIRDAVLAVTGAKVETIPGWRPLNLPKGQILDCSAIAGGARIYLAVSGGFAADNVLGGCGTDLRAGIGGYRGRPLAAGDRLRLADTPSRSTSMQDHQVPRWFAAPHNLIPRDPEGRLRILRGPQADWFSDAEWQNFLSAKFVVTRSSNRMGIRLQGPAIEPATKREMTSEPVVHGAIQVPPDGQPILLTADRQTIGGYPMIACVISADWPALGRLLPGSDVRFVETTHAEAEALLRDFEYNLAIVAQAIEQHAYE